jgi:glycosyltransferase involved in cell wall biosynthesis
MLTAPSRALAKTVSERWGLVLDDIPIIRNPVNTKLFSPAQYRQKQAPTLLFAGRLDRRKGFDVFMRSLPEIIHRVPDLIVRVVGETNPWDRSFDMELTTLKEDSKRRGEFGRIVFVGSVSRKDMPEQYRMADVVAVPSRYDNSPNTLIEAISCGIPVVGAATGGIPEYLDNGRIGIIVAPESPSAVADAIVGLLKDADRRLHLGKASREWIMENCDRRIVARRTSELHEEVVKRFKAGFALDGIGIKQRPILESVIRETGGEGFLRRRMDFIRFMKCFVRKLKTVVK